ncbi:MAG TPA: tyrosinase family protein [Allosphingosinicella sp.]|nr:tyrosinase family protein [Allosphingosinicella sp.]
MGIEHRDELVDHPTFLEHIRYFFDAIDIDHMKRQAGMDLATYEAVQAKAVDIYFQVSGGQMPPEPERRWPPARVQTFRNWIADQCPRGAASLDLAALGRAPDPRIPTRKNAASLPEAERARVGRAFQALIDRDPDDPNSYFSLAGIHWFPAPTFCVHHQPAYNPWHRVYIDRFEAAMRTVPGCEDVTLPYWDILEPVPDWLTQPPFDSYRLPRQVAPAYPANMVTRRNPPDVIAREVRSYPIAHNIREALNAPTFDKFRTDIEAAHDNGHVSCGDSMDTPDIASFDPLFWFFHCNWERMWWAWQSRYDATDLASFRSTLPPGNVEWLDDPLFNRLRPFGVETGSTIASGAYAYDALPAGMFRERALVESGHVALGRSFQLSPHPRLSLRVKGIDRLRLRGSFVVHLFADGEEVAKQAFFQSLTPQDCAACAERAAVDVDFILDRAEIAGKSLEARIETRDPERVDPWVSLSQVGNPTINVRELLINE